MAELRRRARRPESPTHEADADLVPAVGEAGFGPWYSTRMVRLILVALAVFALMHLFLWKVVYDFWMAENHDRLRQSVREAIDSLYRVVEHL